VFHHHHGVEVYTDTGGAGFMGGAVLVALFVGLLAFGLARDRQLPGSRVLSGVNQTTGTPLGCCVAVGLLTAVFFLQYGGVAYVVIAGTGMTFLAYLLCNVAVSWGIAMVVNLYWHRPQTNPTADETSGALHFGIGFLDGIPVQWLVLGVVTLLGVAYYAMRHRHLPSPLLAPGRDDVTDDERAVAARA
jgi:hypothetical protein